jgi:phosphatidylglycerophosphatase A
MRAAALAIATCFGVGYVPFAPGTAGSLAGLLLWVVLPGSQWVQVAAIALGFAAGAWAAGEAERHFRSTDPGPVVIDEVMGMLVSLFLIPVGWAGAVLGFIWFRVFDVFKPYPANRFEHLPGGVGVMADDFMAAVYANLALRGTLVTWNWVVG